jgi:hypothetical protein
MRVGRNLMKTVLCYTHLEAASRLALVSDGIEPVMLETLGQHGYWTALAGLWEQREGFVLIEGDIVVFPGAVRDMVDCTGDWIARPYWINGELKPAFGCIKFSTALIERHPMLFLDLPEEHRNWMGLDMRVFEALEKAGEELTVRWPAVTHLKMLHCPERQRYGI